MGLELFFTIAAYSALYGFSYVELIVPKLLLFFVPLVPATLAIAFAVHYWYHTGSTLHRGIALVFALPCFALITIMSFIFLVGLFVGFEGPG